MDEQKPAPEVEDDIDVQQTPARMAEDAHKMVLAVGPEYLQDPSGPIAAMLHWVNLKGGEIGPEVAQAVRLYRNQILDALPLADQEQRIIAWLREDADMLTVMTAYLCDELSPSGREEAATVAVVEH
jgi:hypothetical protein